MFFFVVPSSLPLAVSEVRISPGFRVMVPAVGCCWLEVCSDASGPQWHVHARMSCMCWVMLSGCWLSVGRNAAASRARRGELSSPVLSWRVMAVPTAAPTTAAPTRCHRRPLRSRRQSQRRHVHARMSCMCWAVLSGCWLSAGRNAAASRARRGELSPSPSILSFLYSGAAAARGGISTCG